MNGSTLTADAFFLPPGQAKVLAFIRAYYAVTREACPATLISRRLDRNPDTIRDHFAALHRKGWLKTDSSPATPEEKALRFGIIRLPR